MTDKDCISLCNSVNSLLTDKKPAVQFSSGILQTESEIYDDEHGCEYLSSLTEKKYESWVMFSDCVVRNFSIDKLVEKINDLLEAEFFFADDGLSLRVKRLNDSNILMCRYSREKSSAEESEVYTHVSVCVRQDILHFDEFDESKVRYALWYRNDNDRMVPFAQVFEGFEK